MCVSGIIRGIFDRYADFQNLHKESFLKIYDFTPICDTSDIGYNHSRSPYLDPFRRATSHLGRRVSADIFTPQTVPRMARTVQRTINRKTFITESSKNIHSYSLRFFFDRV